MKGPAGKGIVPAIETSTYDTWKEFTNAMKKAFGESVTRKAAKMHIKALRQSSTVNNYWTKFQTDIDLIEWNEGALKDKFYKPLNPKIRDRLANNTDKPKELHPFVTFCIDLNNELTVNRSRQTKYDIYIRAKKWHSHPTPKAQPQY